MGSFIDITGQTFGRLYVVKQVEDQVAQNGRRRKMWLCKCECGNAKVINGDNLKSGYTQSCGCLQKQRAHEANTVHGDTDSRLYNVWSAIKRRCYQPYEPKYDRYGGRGIKMCDEWRDDYSAFMKWAIENGYDSNAERGECTIDRIDNNADYCPENCRWVSMTVQANNRESNHCISYNGETHTIAEWAEKANMPYARLAQRITRYGYSIEKALDMA